MKTITLDAPAKINLFLDVTARREDGYHDISSVMLPVTLADRITVSYQAGDAGIQVDCDTAVVADMRDNIAYRAAQLFFEQTALPPQDTHITIEKKIPAAAGLAGGSTDAAAVLIALDELCGTHLGEQALCALGAKLGADVPFCIVKRPMLTEGIGDIFTPVSSLPDCAIVIAKDGEGVSTKQAYEQIDAIGCGVHRPTETLLDALSCGSLTRIGDAAYNIFEQVTLPVRPRAQALKDFFRTSGAVFTLMSGSGPSVFAIFADEKTAQIACDTLRARGIDAHTCRQFH